MMSIDEAQKIRLLKFLKLIGIIAVSGFLYYLFMCIFDTGIPCPIHYITGMYCPGCGISRMFLALIQGDVKAAVSYNMLIMFILPFFVVFAVCKSFMYIKKGIITFNRVDITISIILFLFTIVFCFLRNTEKFYFLVPDNML